MTFDADGEVLSVAVSEPRFTRAEVALLLASRRAENAPRGEHGLLLSEAMDPKSQFAFEPTGAVTDWAQKVLNKAREDYRKKYPQADMGAVNIRVRKKS